MQYTDIFHQLKAKATDIQEFCQTETPSPLGRTFGAPPNKIIHTDDDKFARDMEESSYFESNNDDDDDDDEEEAMFTPDEVLLTPSERRERMLTARERFISSREASGSSNRVGLGMPDFVTAAENEFVPGGTLRPASSEPLVSYGNNNSDSDEEDESVSEADAAEEETHPMSSAARPPHAVEDTAADILNIKDSTLSEQFLVDQSMPWTAEETANRKKRKSSDITPVHKEPVAIDGAPIIENTVDGNHTTASLAAGTPSARVDPAANNDSDASAEPPPAKRFKDEVEAT